ncbi:MAG: hypothetical protein ABFD89_29430 [Bryobacteraceae bacterium]
MTVIETVIVVELVIWVLLGLALIGMGLRRRRRGRERIIDGSLKGATGADLATAIISHLIDAGWKSISGSGTDQVLQSAAGPGPAQSISVQICRGVRGDCAHITFHDPHWATIPTSLYVFAGESMAYRIIACRYSFFIVAADSSTSRQVLCGGALAALVGGGAAAKRCGWMVKSEGRL